MVLDDSDYMETGIHHTILQGRLPCSGRRGSEFTMGPVSMDGVYN
jgi:hypothetical protein